MTDGLLTGDDGIPRCHWATSHPLYLGYHDHEWGRPEGDDVVLFQKVCLEGFQSGLSWLTILKKRSNFRRAFARFELEAVAAMDGADVERLMGDASIVRNRRKIEATIHNAQRALRLQESEGSLAAYFWGWEPPRRPALLDWEALKVTAKTPESVAMAKDLKQRGWRFVGPTTAYAFMQAMGVVNDHVAGCAVGVAVEEEARAWTRPIRQRGGE